MSQAVIKTLTIGHSFNGVVKYYPSNVKDINVWNNEVGIHKFWINESSNYFSKCQDFVELNLSPGNKDVNLQLGIKEEIGCPEMNVEITSSTLRLCRPNEYFVKCKNTGTNTALNVTLKLVVPNELTYLSSSIQPNLVTLPEYYFDIGNILPFEEKYIYIQFQNTCDPEKLGNTLCVEAHIYPDTICDLDTLWNGGSLDLKVKCDQNLNKVVFTATNIGLSDMVKAQPWAIIEDEIMPLLIGDVKLNKGQSKSFEFPANGSTYRMIAEQIEHHPGSSKPNIAIEGCGVNSNGGFSKGFITRFKENEEDKFISIDCKEIRGAFDPNDKIVVPSGFGPHNYIQNEDRLEYTVRFQNIGNDYAEHVRITDKLDPNLDVSTFEIIGNSHPVTFMIVRGYIEFVFANIHLPYKSLNEDKSIGFISYAIKSKPGLAKGIKLDNKADIFFDFNPAIATNTVSVKIFEPFITKTIDYSKDGTLRIYPNPARDMINIELSENSTPAKLEIYSVDGLKLLEQNLKIRISQVDLKQWITKEGLYIIQVSDKKGHKHISKMIISSKE